MSFAVATPGKTRIGWMGTGVMGRWMCQHAMARGYAATVYNRSSDKAAPLVEAGADFLAVSAGVWQHPEGPGAAVAEFGKLVQQHRAFDPRLADLAAIMEDLGEPELGMPGEG